MTDIAAGTAPTVSFLHNPHSPDVFADAAAGFFNLNGNIRITLESLRVDHIAVPGPMARVVIGRLVMPLPAAEALVGWWRRAVAPAPSRGVLYVQAQSCAGP
jgi:hypothetical protein